MKKGFIAVLALLVAAAMLFGCGKAGSTVNADDLTLTEFSASAQQSESTSAEKQTLTAKTTKKRIAAKAKKRKAKTTAKQTKRNKTTAKRVKNKSGKKTSTTLTTTVPHTTKPTTAKKVVDKTHCSLTVQCTEVLDHLDDLAEGHEYYVPRSGYLLNSYSVTFEQGDTVYDVLRRACRELGIRMYARHTVYGMYVVGINNIDEFDCGGASGWTYYVDGKFPMVACSEYELSGGEEIEFVYVCQEK